MTNDEGALDVLSRPWLEGAAISSFVIRHSSFVIRHSSFAPPHFTVRKKRTISVTCSSLNPAASGGMTDLPWT